MEWGGNAASGSSVGVEPGARTGRVVLDKQSSVPGLTELGLSTFLGRRGLALGYCPSSSVLPYSQNIGRPSLCWVQSCVFPGSFLCASPGSMEVKCFLLFGFMGCFKTSLEGCRSSRQTQSLSSACFRLLLFVSFFLPPLLATSQGHSWNSSSFSLGWWVTPRMPMITPCPLQLCFSYFFVQ